MQKRPERCRPGVRTELLVGEFDLDGLIGAFELNSRCHRLVSRACAHRLLVFLHKDNQLTNGGSSPTALLRLRGWQCRLAKELENANARLGGWII